MPIEVEDFDRHKPPNASPTQPLLPTLSLSIQPVTVLSQSPTPSCQPQMRAPSVPVTFSPHRTTTQQSIFQLTSCSQRVTQIEYNSIIQYPRTALPCHAANRSRHCHSTNISHFNNHNRIMNSHANHVTMMSPATPSRSARPITPVSAVPHRCIITTPVATTPPRCPTMMSPQLLQLKFAMTCLYFLVLTSNPHNPNHCEKSIAPTRVQPRRQRRLQWPSPTRAQLNSRTHQLLT